MAEVNTRFAGKETEKAMTYIESKQGLTDLSEEYTEEALQNKFAAQLNELSARLSEYAIEKEELEAANREANWDAENVKTSLLAHKVLARYTSLEKAASSARKMYDDTAEYANLLAEYGDEFAQLYRIKNNSEENDEKLVIQEIDVTDNGDLLIQDKYFKMQATGQLKELVLHVELGNDENQENPEESFGFNFGVMTFDQPNQPPQVKMQLSFDEETLKNLDEIKLKKIFDFCESHGISVADMEIRNFDGTLNEREIKEKIAKILENTQKEKAELLRQENIKEAEQQTVRRKELEAELQNIRAANGGKMPAGISWDDVSVDVVQEEKVMVATTNPYYMSQTMQNAPQTQNTQNAYIPQQRTASGNVALQDVAEQPAVNVITKVQSKAADAQNKADIISEAVQELEQPRSNQNVGKVQTETSPKVTNADEINSQATQEVEAAPNNNTKEANFVERHTAAIEHSAQPAQAQNIQISEAQQQDQQLIQQQAQVQAQSQSQPPAQKKVKMKDVEKNFEKMFEDDWHKRKNRSYFKTHTGWFGRGWTEYIFYDNENEDNRKNDGIRQDDGSVKYTYSFKLFLKQDKDGNLHFTYRTPNRRKADPDTIGDIADKIKSLGYTHLHFPAGLLNAEKEMWRKAMGKSAIVPIGMSIGVKQAKDLLDAAKKSDKYDAQQLAEYGYKIAKQMEFNNAQKRKVPNEAEAAYIQGLINTHRYFAFTHAYSDKLKTKIEIMLKNQNKMTGSPDKFAAYLTLSNVFEAYKEALDRGGSLLNVSDRLLSAREKQEITRYGLDGNVQKLNPEQMDKLFDIMYTRQYKEEYVKFRDLLLESSFSSDRGPKLAPNVVFTNELGYARGRAKGIASELKRLGIEDFVPFEDTNLRFEFQRFFLVDKPEYERTHSAGSAQSMSNVVANGQAENVVINRTVVRAKTNDKIMKNMQEVKKLKMQQAGQNDTSSSSSVKEVKIRPQVSKSAVTKAISTAKGRESAVK